MTKEEEGDVGFQRELERKTWGFEIYNRRKRERIMTIIKERKLWVNVQSCESITLTMI